jgi:parallel beta-helix repeat protein
MHRFLMFLLALAALAVGVASWAQSPSSVEAAGPSQALFNSPFYTCVRNFYVATTGNDANNGSAGSPWRTIQNADTSSRTGGDCINVAPGTYQAGVLVQHGGTAPTATGYVVYRCQVLDACHILAPGGGHLWGFANTGNFVVVDGFELDGNNSLQTDGIADTCIGTDDATYGAGGNSTQAGASSHHIWVLNNIIHHCNLAGVNLSGKEWYYTIHNTVYHNSFSSGYQGSGIGYVVVQCIEAGGKNCYTSGAQGVPASDYSYAPSSNDLTASQPAGYFPFHNVVAWNAVYNNRINYNNSVGCANHTDGNGIIMDTFLDLFSNTLVYPYQTLVMGNVSYYNGGRGVHVFRTSNVTVANNTVFNNNTDTCLASAAFALGDLSQQGGTNNVWINNVSKAVQNRIGNNCALLAGNGDVITDVNNTFASNVLSTAESSTGNLPCLFDNDVSYFSCSSNKCSTDPLFVNATAGVAAGSNNQPTGGTWTPGNSNFAIATSSPAYNYGQLQSYLSAQASDSGSCYHTLPSCPTKAVNTHDFNGDGKSDIAWRDTSGDTAIWLMNGAQVAQSAGVGTVATTWSIVGQRDFDGDGKADLLWRDGSSGNVAIWLMNGVQLTQIAVVATVPAAWSIVGTGDFNGDGKGDILWQNTTTGDVALWLMNGAQITQAAGVATVPTTWSIVGTGDFNGDGKTDILWRDSSGNVAIWLMNGAQVTQVTSVAAVPTAWTIVGTGDFDGDGKSDILWLDGSGNVALWLMNGAQITQNAGLGAVSTAWTIVETGDFDGDGKSDVLWHDTSGNVGIWFMNGTQVRQLAGVGNEPTAWSIQGANAD